MSDHFLGIDLGSSFTKFVVINGGGDVLFQEVIKTLSRRRELFQDTIERIHKNYSVAKTCSTGYGRDYYKGDFQSTELICASAGVSQEFPQHKEIIDIGGEDIKVIESDAEGNVLNFHMNDKCSAGTGTFITEIAEKAEIEIEEMNDMARASNSEKTINSFCTVFAKTEILGWKFNGIPVEDIARGIYLSIVTRIVKLPTMSELPIYLCGGVIAYHPYLRELLTDEFGRSVQTVSHPQFTVARGAASLAAVRYQKERAGQT